MPRASWASRAASSRVVVVGRSAQMASCNRLTWTGSGGSAAHAPEACEPPGGACDPGTSVSGCGPSASTGAHSSSLRAPTGGTDVRRPCTAAPDRVAVPGGPGVAASYGKGRAGGRGPRERGPAGSGGGSSRSRAAGGPAGRGPAGFGVHAVSGSRGRTVSVPGRTSAGRVVSETPSSARTKAGSRSASSSSGTLSGSCTIFSRNRQPRPDRPPAGSVPASSG